MHKTLHRLLLLVVALATGAISLIAVAPAAHAATYPTVTKISSTKSTVLHGTTVKIYGCGQAPSYAGEACAPFGTLTLQRRVVGGSWTNISARYPSPENARPSWVITPSASAYYRVAWNGGSFESNTFSPTAADDRQTRLIRVARNLHDKWVQSSFTFGGLVTPTYAGKYVYIQRTTCSNPQSTSCKWSYYKAIKTTSSSRWSVKLPAYSQTNYFRAYVKPSSGYAPSYSRYYIETKRYRPATPRLVR